MNAAVYGDIRSYVAIGTPSPMEQVNNMYRTVSMQNAQYK